ncbi:MAG: hypothetical protein RSB96_01085 [Oscillospiraceae bacterium]
MIALITNHLQRYPKMQPQDVVKLMYQHEFGCGHMVINPQSSLLRLQEEVLHICKEKIEEAQLFEQIGNKLCRINLNELENRGSLETLNCVFVYTANCIKGNITSFEQKLEVLKADTKDMDFLFSHTKFCDYLHEYKILGYPVVSHSEEYKLAYRPSYRVIIQEYEKYFSVFCKIDALLKTGKNITIAIDGNCASGKSTLAQFLSKIYDCNVISMDDFFLQSHQKTKERLFEIGGNIDYERFMHQVVKNIENSRQIAYEQYNCQTQVLDNLVYLMPKKLTIIEGVYSMRDDFLGVYDLKIFLSIDPVQQLDRILKRNGAEMQLHFQSEWIPLENQYFDNRNIAQKCDLVY